MLNFHGLMLLLRIAKETFCGIVGHLEFNLKSLMADEIKFLEAKILERMSSLYDRTWLS